jgi:hypothetical protein
MCVLAAKTKFTFFCPKVNVLWRKKKYRVPSDAEKYSKHFRSVHLFMKVKIEKDMGNQRLFGSKI